MLPPLNHPIWRKLVSGEKQIESTNFSINMVLTNSRIRYRNDPGKLDQIIRQAHEVFTKLERIVPSEVAQLNF